MLLVVKHKHNQKQILKIYLKKLDLIKQYCKSDISLSHHQKQRINLFLDRCIYFCKTMKIIQYDKTVYKFNGQVVISSINQYRTYCSIYNMLQNLLKELTADVDLEFQHKIQLSKCLGYTIAHVLGKLNHKNVDPHLTSQRGKSVNL